MESFDRSLPRRTQRAEEYECNVCGDKKGTANGHRKHMMSH